jgi:hypothetical protein
MDQESAMARLYSTAQVQAEGSANDMWAPEADYAEIVRLRYATINENHSLRAERDRLRAALARAGAAPPAPEGRECFACSSAPCECISEAVDAPDAAPAPASRSHDEATAESFARDHAYASAYLREVLKTGDHPDVDRALTLAADAFDLLARRAVQPGEDQS